MADLSQTRANVKLGNENRKTRLVQFGESVLQGQPIYADATSNKFLQTDANVSAAVAKAEGIVLTPASTDGWGIVVTEGLIDIGATLVVGESYYVSRNKGAIMPVGDLQSGDYPTFLGIAVTTSLLDLQIRAGGVAKP